MRKNLIQLTLILFFLSLAAACTYSKSMQAETGAGSDPLSGMIQFYRGPLNHFEAVRTGECPMYPSDSQYGLQSIQKHGMLIGWVMAVDRLMRCGRDETRLSPPVIVDGKLKYYDPVEKNDFWWSDQ
jgi:putative component of membrane protein insertase Oxa1/YidC/SpoIIIJ protein YidD